MSNLRTIKIRGDSTENWEQANPILEYKEIACEFTGSGTLFKVGNGTDSWNDLSYASGTGDVEEAPSDGKQYVRKDSTWVEVVVEGNAVTSVSGKTGAVTLAKEDVGLSNVDNTSDSNKPISNPTQAALDSKVDKVTGKGLSDENYTSSEKTKLSNIAAAATKNRADSLNADKDHTHTTAQVSGLDDALAGKASTDDSRFTNSREWTASVVPQAEAEAGTSTTARKWTAQRVRQAVLGWWNTSTFKTKLDGIETGATKNRADTLNADKEHTHTITQVTGLDSALSGKVDKETGKGLIEPAPVDGKQYVRKDAAWTEVQSSAPSIALDDLTDVSAASPSNQSVLTWKSSSNSWEPEWPAIPSDAPADGNYYARHYNSWQRVPTPPTPPTPDVEEAPVDGKLYGRISGTWMEAPRFPTGVWRPYPHWLLDGQTKQAKLEDFHEVTWGTPSDGEALVYNSSTQKLEFSPVGGSGGGGVEEAPNDFYAYVRKGNAWVVGVEGGATIVKAGINSAAPGANGVAIGNKSNASNAASVAIGFNARSRRVDSIAIGNDALNHDYPLGGTGKIAIGASSITNGDGAIALGKGAEAKFASGVAIGPTATCGSTNEIRIGNDSAVVKVQNAIVEVSDARDKADIQPHSLGLNFLELLEPVKWKSDPRSQYAPRESEYESEQEWKDALASWDRVSHVSDGSRKGERFQYGLIAQQVKEVLDQLGEDFSGYKDDSVTANGEGDKGLSYSSFISPIILAIQQLSSEVKDLKQEVRDLEQEVRDLREAGK